MGGFLRMLEARPKDLGGPDADQIFALRGSPECFAVRLFIGDTPWRRPAVQPQNRTLTQFKIRSKVH